MSKTTERKVWFDPCQVCEGAVDGISGKNDWEPRYRMEPLWPDGPLVPVGMIPEGHTFIRAYLTVEPCGHEQPRPDEFHAYQRTGASTL